LKQLESSFNPEASKIVKDIELGRDIILDQANIALFSGNFQLEPSTLDQAWNHADPKDQDNWRNVIKKELIDMESKKVWEVIKKEGIPEGRRTIKNKWIFKIKRNGVFRARLVACGYSQVPGIVFNESFDPVINDVSLRIMLVSKLIWDLQVSIIDVKTAFLNGELQEEIYINVPEASRIDPDYCLKLKRAIYGLVPSAREFYKKLTLVLKSMGFKENKSDPCLLSKWHEDGVMLIGIYVDDCLVIGTDERIAKLIDDLMIDGFNLKVENSLKDYLSCCVIETKNLNQITILQPHLINKFAG
jgi:Reverse transcriptase (RNA-dependent DNA polymerase)